MIRMLSDDLWTRLTAYANGASSAFVATAYLGKGARRLLPLGKGSVLVVDFSMSAVKSGVTNPDEVLRFIKSGVEVHSVENLHAKVFVFPRRAIVGSSNVSANSRNTLVEAALETTEPKAVREARQFVRNQMGDRIGPKHCKEMSRHYRPPTWGGRPSAGKRKRGLCIKPARTRIWVVPLVRSYWDKVEQEEAEQGKQIAERQIADKSEFKVGQFIWVGSGLDRVKEGDRLLQATEAGKDCMLAYPGKLLPSHLFEHHGKKEQFVHVELPAKKRGRRLSESRGQLSRELASRIKSAEKPFCVRNGEEIGRIESLWT